MITGPMLVGVCALLWRNSEEFLVGQRAGVHGAGEWWLPGGKPDAGETLEQAVRREVAEETGITDVRHLDPLQTWTYDRFDEHDKHFVCLYFEGLVASDQEAVLMEPEKCTEWRWVTWDTVPSPRDWSIPKLRQEYAGAPTCG